MNIKEYFKSLTVSHKAFSGKCFYTVKNTTETFDFVKKRGVSYPSFLLKEDTEGSISGHDGFVENNSVMFYIVKKKAQEQSVDDIKRECKAIGLQFAAKMLVDRYKLDMLKYFDPKSFSWFGIGPIGDGVYGMGFRFNLSDDLNLTIDEDVWA